MVSKCDCCMGRGYEDINHVLFAGDFAQQFWRKCAQAFGFPFRENVAWKENMKLWFRRASKSSQMGVILGVFPTIITWKLWSRRCKLRMEGHAEMQDEVWYAVRLWLSRIMRKSSKFQKLAIGDQETMRALNILVVPLKPKQIHFIRWMKPKPGKLKLNTDGCNLNNPGASGASGVLRDEQGNVVFAFSVNLGIGSSTAA